MTGKAIILVAVRLKSSRLPRKALADLAGLPLIVRLHRRVAKARLPEAVVWCTSTHPGDDALAELAASHWFECFRGDEFDVLSRLITVGRAQGARTVVRVTGDNPLTDPLMMDHLIAAHRAAGVEDTYTDDPPRGTRSEIFDLAALERCHDLARDPSASEYLTTMIRRPDRFRIQSVPAPDTAWRRPELRLTVDTPEDLAVVRAVHEAFAGDPPPLGEIIAWLDAHPGIRDINRDIRPVELGASVDCGLKGDLG